MCAVLGPVVRWIRPLFEHQFTIADVMQGLQPKLNKVPGMRVFMQNPPAIRIGGRISKEPVSIHAVQPGRRSTLQVRALDASEDEDFEHAGGRHQRPAN